MLRRVARRPAESGVPPAAESGRPRDSAGCRRYLSVALRGTIGPIRAIFLACANWCANTFDSFCSLRWLGLRLRLLFLFRFPAITTDSFSMATSPRTGCSMGFRAQRSGRDFSYLHPPAGISRIIGRLFAIFGMEHYRAVLALQMSGRCRHLFPDRGHGAPPDFAAGRQGGISFGGALPVSRQLCRRCTHGDAGDFLHRVGS